MKPASNLDGQSISIRPAQEHDCDLLFAWVNRPDSLNNKQVTSDPIPYETHNAWFSSRLGRSECAIFVVCVGATPCGQVRLEDKGHGYEVDVFVLPEYRGRGIAAIVLSSAMQSLVSARGETRFVANVLAQNRESQRLFEKLGFLREESSGELHRFGLRLSKDKRL